MLGERQPSNRESSDLLKKSAEELIGRSADKSAGRMGKGSTSSHEEDLLENDDEGKLKGNRKETMEIELGRELVLCLAFLFAQSFPSSRPTMKIPV